MNFAIFYRTLISHFHVVASRFSLCTNIPDYHAHLRLFVSPLLQTELSSRVNCENQTDRAVCKPTGRKKCILIFVVYRLV